MENKQILQKIYIEYLRMHNETALKPRIDEMLLIQLLIERKSFEPLNLTTRNFYKFYQRKIDEKITKIKKDFKITETDINWLKEEKEINYNNEKDEYLLYEDIIELFHKYIKRGKNTPPEKVYYKYYNYIYEIEPPKKTTNKKLSKTKQKKQKRGE